jgi:hypothetical protein
MRGDGIGKQHGIDTLSRKLHRSKPSQQRHILIDGFTVYLNNPGRQGFHGQCRHSRLVCGV